MEKVKLFNDDFGRKVIKVNVTIEIPIGDADDISQDFIFKHEAEYALNATSCKDLGGYILDKIDNVNFLEE